MHPLGEVMYVEVGSSTTGTAGSSTTTAIAFGVTVDASWKIVAESVW